jgi:plastocyanin
MKMKNIFSASALLLVLVLAVAGCGKKSSETANEGQGTSPEATASTAGGQKVDTSTAGSVSGMVAFDGAAPKPRKIDMSQDPACAKSGAANTVETIATQDGKLANVYVYVKEGVGNYQFETPRDAVELDQEGCRYHPHVLAVMTGQQVKILNSDPTTHNIHPTPKTNREWNESQPPKGEPLTKEFAREEVMLPVKCNQHPWMKMYVNVSKHPYFAVTGSDGKFEIKNLPPGEYTLAAVHESLGEKTMKVKVDQKQDVKDQNFSFAAGGAAGDAQ